MTQSLLAALAEVEASGDSAALCTIVREQGSVPRHAGSKMLVYPDGRFIGTVGGGEMESRVIRAALAALRDGGTQLLSYQLANPAAGDPGVCGGEVEIFVEPIKPLPTVLIIGGGHVGRALVHLAKWLGYRVALSDDRAEYCNASWAPEADEYWPTPVSELVERFKFNSETYIVMPTRGMPLDVEALPQLLDKPQAYLGVIGSRRRWATALKRLEAKGVPAERLAHIHAPMGLELKAETPEEIAVSVMAEIIMLRRGGTGQPMQWKQAADEGEPV
jgi:xanthine dehydrogenase accessory factor